MVCRVAAGVLLCLGVPFWAGAQPEAATADRAYGALNARQYDEAIPLFQQAIQARPDSLALRKDLAYTYLKIGETEAARDTFAAILKLDPAEVRVGLEYGFLCYETKQPLQARRTFDRLRHHADREIQQTAEAAFQNIDRPLTQGIARWRQVVTQDPGNFSGHRELAELAEQQDQPALAAQHYAQAWAIKPGERSLLLDLARVWQECGRQDPLLLEKSRAALLTASRGPDARTAEAARALLPSRYPYVYEFEDALRLEPRNLDLRRELAYLHLAMGQNAKAEQEFARVLEMAPDDLLSTAQLGFLRAARKDSASAAPLLDRVARHGTPELASQAQATLDGADRRSPEDVMVLGDRSLKAGYLKDAARYLTAAHESQPRDASIMLKLGWVYNMLHQDGPALQWFRRARDAGDSQVVAEASRAYESLRPSQAWMRTTTWLYPVFSSRWQNLFGYGQVKTELRLGRLPLRPYLSTRFIGDVRRTVGSAGTQGSVPPQYLSESAVVLGAGLHSEPWHGLVAWGEAGSAMGYLTHQRRADYRGGASYARGWGHLLTPQAKGWFSEVTTDAVFMSRFQNDLLLYVQPRAGWTFGEHAGWQGQVMWQVNATADRLRQYWANTVETGPGVRLRSANLPNGMTLSLSLLRGVHTINMDNPRRPNYWDVRAGVWYAFTR